MKTKKSPQPLLYIAQPEFIYPEVNMQEVFKSKKNERGSLVHNPVESLKEKESSESLPSNEKDAPFSMEILHKTLSEIEKMVEEPIGKKEKETVNARKMTEHNLKEALPEEKESVLAGDESELLQEMIGKHKIRRPFDSEIKALSPRKSQTISLSKAPSFKDMDITDKLEYLVSFPNPLPPVPCIFTTENNTYRGFLLEKNDWKIDIKTFDEKQLSIPIHEVKEVHIIGMN